MPLARSLPSLVAHYPGPPTPPGSFAHSSLQSQRHFPHRDRLHFHNHPQSQSHSLPVLPRTSIHVSSVAHVRPPSPPAKPTTVVDTHGRQQTEPKGILRPPSTTTNSRNNSPARVSPRRVSFASDTKLADRRAEEAAPAVVPVPDTRPARRRFRPGQAKEKKMATETAQKPQQEGQQVKETKGRRSLFGFVPRRSAPASVPTERLGRRKQKQDVTGGGTTGGSRRRNRTT